MMVGSRSVSLSNVSIQSQPSLVIYFSALQSAFKWQNLGRLGFSKISRKVHKILILLFQTRGKHAWGNSARDSTSPKRHDTFITVSWFIMSEDPQKLTSSEISGYQDQGIAALQKIPGHYHSDSLNIALSNTDTVGHILPLKRPGKHQKCSVELGAEIFWSPLAHGFRHLLGTKLL